VIIGQQGHCPFGEMRYKTGQTDKWKFASYERDAESTLDYAVHRYYSYRIGRFQTTEPCALTSSACSGATVSLRLFNPAQQSPAETNLYTYVGNNPLNRTDPLGLQWWCFWGPCDPWGGFYGGGGWLAQCWGPTPNPWGPRQACERNCNLAYASQLMYCTLVGLIDPPAGIVCVGIAILEHQLCYFVCSLIPEGTTW